MPTIAAYQHLFAKIADAFLNHTVLCVRLSGSSSTETAKFFRVAEIEVYFNDYGVH